MPHFDELSVKRLTPEVSKLPEVMRYFPAKIRKGVSMNRSYFFNVLNTVVPGYVEKLVQHANKLRNDIEVPESRMDCIELSDAWYQKLMMHPYVTSK